MTDKTIEQTAKRIRALRQDNHLTQVEFGHKVGIQPNTVARLEHGKHRPSSETIEKIAKAFKIKSSDIVPY